MRLSIPRDEETVELECFDDKWSRKMCRAILEGRVYPQTKLVDDVHVVLDVGANVGAATVYFSLLYPKAAIFAFEPLPAAYRLLEVNTRARRQVQSYPFGLFSHDDEVPLYLGRTGPGTSSIFRKAQTLEASETITLRSAEHWLHENSVSSVDVLKIDTEGCEVPILRGMSEVLPRTKLIHLEYHSEADRKEIDRLLGDTHVLLSAKAMIGTGNLAYVSNESLAASMP